MTDFFNLRKRRFFLLETFKEIFKICFFLRFNMYFYTKTNVFYPAFIMKLMSQPVDKRPESNSLLFLVQFEGSKNSTTFCTR
jgi:hypothetical protein